MFVRANAKIVCVRVFEGICNVLFFLFFLIKIVLYKIAPSFQMIFFLKTHNANRLKCCCNGLTLLLLHAQDRPFGQYCCTVSTIFSYSQVRTRVSYSCHVSFSSYFSDQVKRGYLDFSLWGGDVFVRSVLSAVLDVKCVLHCHAVSFCFAPHEKEQSTRRRKCALKKKKKKKRTRSLVGEFCFRTVAFMDTCF